MDFSLVSRLKSVAQLELLESDSVKFRAILCYFCVYVIWGSTYLAIRYALEWISPLSMAGWRGLFASLILFGVATFRGEAPLSREERHSAISSGILLILANTSVCVAEQWIPSGVTAVMVGSAPLWIALFNGLGFEKARPTAVQVLGMLVGLAGIALLSADQLGQGSGHSGWGTLLISLSVMSWSLGTLLQKKGGKTRSGFRYTALQLACGGLGPLLIGAWLERPWERALLPLNQRGAIAFLYLIVFGSGVAFTAYSWLGRNEPPTRISTYALVNPLVAVWIGSILASEPVTSSVMMATALVLLGLYLLIWKPGALSHRIKA